MIASLLPIRFNTHKNVVSNTLETNETVINIDNKDDIKINIENILFNFKYDCVLVKFNNELFVCEPISARKKQYSRRKVKYHPLMDKVK